MAMSTNNWNSFEFSNAKWLVPPRYINLLPLGKGTFGLVCSADDTKRNQKVAIKKLSVPFSESVHFKRAYREIRLLRHVNHDNLICLLDLFTEAQSAEELSGIYFSTYFMETDLNNVLKTEKLTDGQITFFSYQILRGLKYLHSANIIHRDLKPSNLVVDENCGLRIIDFGLARTENVEMTGYVATRWYRAPEIILKWMHYGKGVDVWSVGCIIAEMYLSRPERTFPIFPGNGHVDQLNRILNVVGYPSQEFMREIDEESRNYLEKMNEKPRRVNFQEYFKEINSVNAIDLIDKMLQLDPSVRITCDKALESPYLESYYDSDDEPNAEPFTDFYENKEMNVLEWKHLIFNEIKSFQASNPS